MDENNLNNVDIIEIGGGYGGLCFFINKLASLFDITISTYTIFDLPEPLMLQKKYLEALNCNINLNFAELDNFSGIKENSFLVSTYAFSEIPLEIQKEYTKKILNPYVSHGFIAWNSIDFYNFIDNCTISKEIEFPYYNDKNYFIKFKPVI